MCSRGSGTGWIAFRQNWRVFSVEAAATIDCFSSVSAHFASNATFGVHSAPLMEVTPSAVQFHARYATNGSTQSGALPKSVSTPYLTWGKGRLARSDLLDNKGRLRHGNGRNHGWIALWFVLRARQKRRKIQRLNVDDLNWLSDFTHSVFSRGDELISWSPACLG
jgi:hypothetical protein